MTACSPPLSRLSVFVLWASLLLTSSILPLLISYTWRSVCTARQPRFYVADFSLYHYSCKLFSVSLLYMLPYFASSFNGMNPSITGQCSGLGAACQYWLFLSTFLELTAQGKHDTKYFIHDMQLCAIYVTAVPAEMFYLHPHSCGVQVPTKASPAPTGPQAVGCEVSCIARAVVTFLNTS